MKPVTFPRIGLDMFVTQVIWTFFALGIFILINIIQKIFNMNVDSIYNSGFIASNIYMLIIGIIVITFLNYHVELGITRKNYFYGTALASIGLSLVIPVILYVVSLVESFIINRFTSFTIETGTLDGVLTEVVTDVDGNIIAEIVLSLILTPFTNPETNLLLSFAVFSLNIFIFYIVGWLIGAAFKQTGVIGGILFTLLGIAIVAVKDSMMRLAMDAPLFKNFAFLEVVPQAMAIPVIVFVILVTFVLIRLLTRRAEVNI